MRVGKAALHMCGIALNQGYCSEKTGLRKTELTGTNMPS